MAEKDYYTEGVPVPETPPPGVEPAPWGKTHAVGARRPRVDAYERVSGAAVYPSDLCLPDMLHGAVLRTPHPRARVKKVDAAKAAGMPGVRAVITGDDPLARSVRWPWSGTLSAPLLDPTCRFEGEAVAAVAAESAALARDALRAIAVEYEVLPPLVDLEKALDPGAPEVQEGGNVANRVSYARGDVARGFAEADAVVEETFRTACEIHTPLEPHGCVARWDGDALTLWESTQGVYNVQARVAEVLGLPLSRVRVVGHYVGGGFGSKLQLGKYTILAALLAKKAARPVKLFLAREETLLAVGNRPPAVMTLKAGARKDGTLTALQFAARGSGGAYPAGGVGSVDWLIRDLYLCPNVKSEMTDVFINAGPARPFRAPGHPQGSWALEQTLDLLAEKLGLDPVDLRLRNIPTVSQGRDGSPPYTSTGLRECIVRGAAEFGWGEARRRAEATRSGPVRRGVGMAAGLWIAGGGGPPSTVVLKLFADGSVNLNMGASDIGTGTKTVMAMVVAEELGVKPEYIQIEHADTGTTQFATGSGGSKTVPTESPAVRAAAVEVKRQLFALAADELKVPVEALDLVGGEIVDRRDPAKKTGLSALEKLKKRGVVVGVGYRGPNPGGKIVNPFAAQFCEVEADVRTGEVRVVRFLGTNDSGRVMNRATFDSQVFGGITMGIGLALTEERVLDDGQTGKMCNRNWHDYQVPTALDVPATITSVPIDAPDALANTAGAKGLGEPATIPTAGAVANAVAHALGVRIRESPITPIAVNRALAGRKG
jgi:xanthine dehydrogenase YagR molybdenum-binding subunit